MIDIPLKKHQTLFMRQILIKNAPLCRCSHRRLLFMLQTQLMTSKSSTMTLGLVEALLRLCEISSNCNSTKGSVTSDSCLKWAEFRAEEQIFGLRDFFCYLFHYCDFLAYAFFGLFTSLLRFFAYFWPKNRSNETNSPKNA